MSGETTVKETVVLVYGLWMRGWVMALLGLRLRRCGFHTVVFSYPSMRASLSQNALSLARFVAEITAPRIHFIGHSLGGLLVLQMLAQHAAPRAGRVVLLGSPYHVSYTASKLARIAPRYCLIGRSMRQWLEQEAPECAGRYQVGAIAGSRSLGGGRLLGGLPYPNDGVVTVEETRMPGASDWIALDVSHSSMLFSAGAARQACAFLQHGHFLHNLEPL